MSEATPAGAALSGVRPPQGAPAGLAAQDHSRASGPQPLWTSAEIAAATGSQVVGEAFRVQGVCIDSREVQAGDLFVALSGERDGNAFAASALAAGAAGALVSRPLDGARHIVVPDTLRALEQLSVAARDRAPARRCAVTGSVGKTGVTQAIAAALALAGRSHAPVRSFNNHIGVPLTLARMPRETERAVFELGMNHPGEITPLSRLVQPHVAVITTVGAVHTENFADGEAGVARAKAEIFDGLAPGGAAVLNADDGWVELLSERARARGARVLRFGAAPGCDARLIDVQPPMITASVHGRTLRFPIAQAGAHWGLNSLAVLLALGELDAPISAGLEALAAFAPLQGRGAQHRIRVRGGEATLIDESYNANPMSVGSALRTLGDAEGRRIAVLTDMLELGPDAERRHAALAQPIEAAAVDLVFCAGPMMRALWDALPPSRRGACAAGAEGLLPELSAALQPGDVVMVKGSKGSKASVVVDALLTADRAPVTAQGEAG